MRKMLPIIYLLLIPALISASGTKGAAFLKIPTGSRPISMGEAYTALGNDVNCIHWNPGGLVFNRYKEIQFMRSFWFLGTSYNYLAFSLPSAGYGAFGLAVSYMHYGDFDGYDEHYQPLPGFSAYDMDVALSYSQLITNSLSIGFNLKYIMEKIEEHSGNAFALDFGLRYRKPKTPYLFAFSIKNLGTSMTLDKEGYPLPLQLTGGAALYTNRFVFPVDICFSTDDGLILSGGAEYKLASILKLRAGYKMGANPGGLAGFRSGLGLSVGSIYLDYAVAPYSDLGISHILTLGVKI